MIIVKNLFAKRVLVTLVITQKVGEKDQAEVGARAEIEVER